MSKGKILGKNEVSSRRTVRFRYRRVLLTSIATLAPALPISLVVASQPAFAAAKTNFVGKWNISGGYLGITFRSENRATGACAGVTASSLYHIIGCPQTGNRYAFTITEGATYRSRNVGTIAGNKITGSFNDSNGTSVPYTGVR